MGLDDATTALGFARRMPRPPTFSNAGQGESSLTIERYQQSSAEIDLPPLPDHRLTLHLSGLTSIEKLDQGSKRQWSDAGQIFVNPAGEAKRCHFKGRPNLLMLHIPRSFINEVALEAFAVDPDRVVLVQQFAVPDLAVDQLGRLMMTEAETGGLGGQVMIDTLARALAVHLLRRYSSIAPARLDQPTPMPGWRLRQVIDFMKANLSGDLSLPQLASVAGLGSSQFAHAFRIAVGQPPYRYLVSLRIERARELLEHTTLPVIDIAMQCGFQQPNHFTTMFGKVTGMSPRAYRQARCT